MLLISWKMKWIASILAIIVAVILSAGHANSQIVHPGDQEDVGFRADAQIAREIQGVNVVEIIDGDRVTVKIGGLRKDIFYAGIDAPEKGEPFYEEALEFNSKVALGKTVTLQVESGAHLQEPVSAYVFLEDQSQAFVNAKLIEEGLAEVTPEQFDSQHFRQLVELQADARKTHKGIWVYENSASPRVIFGKSMWKDAVRTLTTSFVFFPIHAWIMGVLLFGFFFIVVLVAGPGKKRTFLPIFIAVLGLVLTLAGVRLGLLALIFGILAIIANMAVPGRPDLTKTRGSGLRN